MRVLKIIGITLLVIVILLALLAFIMPTSYRVEKSIEIDAPASLVYEQAAHWDNFQTWNPWSGMDSSMTIVYEGEFGKAGSKYTWEGNDDIGAGSQEITAATPEQVDVDLKFIKPFESEAKTQFLFEPAGEGTKVTWVMSGESPRPWNIMSIFMKGAIGKDYQKGLENLKSRCETMVAERMVDGFLIQDVTLSDRSYVGKRATVKFEEIEAFYSNNLGAIFGALGAKGVQAVGMPSGVYYKWDEEAGTADMMAAIPCPVGTTLDGFESVNVGGKALVVDHYGPYEQTEKAHIAISTYMEKNKLDLNVHVIEEYVTDPGEEPDSSKWLTKIYYMLK